MGGAIGFVAAFREIHTPGLKTTDQLRKARRRGHRKLNWNFTLAAAAYNLTRTVTLTA